MDRQTVISLLNETGKGLWPDWNLTDIELDLYSETLMRYDKSTVIVAMKKLKLDKRGGYKQPKISDLIEIIGGFLPEPKSSNYNPAANKVWVYNLRCVEAGKAVNSRLCEPLAQCVAGQCFPCYEDKEIAADKELMRKSANTFRIWCEQNKGGKWETEMFS
jgi:hypothetical protein